MPPPSNTEAPPLPASTSTAAGTEAAANAARAAVEAAQSTPSSGISPEGSGSIVGTTFAPEKNSESPAISPKTPGTGLIPVVKEPTTPAPTAFTEAVASHETTPVPDTTPEADAKPEASALPASQAGNPPSSPDVAPVVSPLDDLPLAKAPDATVPPAEATSLPQTEDVVQVNIDSPQPALPHYADAAPGSDNLNRATAAEALAATPEGSQADIFPGSNQELQSKYDKQISEANQEYLAATNPQAKFEALVKLEIAARLAQTPLQQELHDLESA